MRFSRRPVENTELLRMTELDEITRRCAPRNQTVSQLFCKLFTPTYVNILQ